MDYKNTVTFIRHQREKYIFSSLCYALNVSFCPVMVQRKTIDALEYTVVAVAFIDSNYSVFGSVVRYEKQAYVSLLSLKQGHKYK